MSLTRHRFFIAMIKFENVTYSYSTDKSKPVLKDLSLTINEGENIALMGGNGCGKTTFGLLICAIIKPDSGRIVVDGNIIGESEDQPPIGFLFQDPDNGLVATTVEREVAFSLENRNMQSESMQGTVSSTLGLFNLTAMRERLVWNLSGGEKQRLSLAGIIVAKPKILFLDEPASFLDFAGSVKLDETLEQITRVDTSITVIRVTQYPVIADRHDRLIVINEGQLLADDSPAEVFSNKSALTNTGIRPPFSYLTPRSEYSGKTIISSDTLNKYDKLLDINNISYSHHCVDGPRLFKQLSLSITAGEVLALVGPSGAGKSTLAQMICGIHAPTEGSIDFINRNHRGVMSFQQPERQFFLDTAYDEIAYSIRAKNKYRSSLDDMVRHNMNMVGLDYDTFKDRDPHTLSGGEARRLAFATVVALDSELIIFDEPTCGLDEAGIGFFVRLVESLRAEGRTVLIISHNSDIIIDLADRIALLLDGTIVRTEATLDFFEQGAYKGVLQFPEVIQYQKRNYGKVKTLRAQDLFDLEGFYA
jgi:energy-coupling factor transport system ATP-binding protein